MDNHQIPLRSKIRKRIYDIFLTTGKGPVEEELMNRFKLSRTQIREILNKLYDQHLIVLDTKINTILIANPFSNIPTNFVVKTTQEEEYFASCAWDALAFHTMLNEQITIESSCYYCNNSIHLQLTDGIISQKKPQETILHIDRPPRSWWDDIVDTCFNGIKFFCSSLHLDEWIENLKITKGATPSDDQILGLCEFLYQNKLEIDYNRPTNEETIAKFKELGLISDFWNLKN